MARNPYYSGPPSDHFDGLRFFPPGGPKDKNLRDIARWAREARKRVAWPKDLPAVVHDHPPERVHGHKLRVSFIGHSSFLIQTEGVNLLLDPIWARRAGPWGRVGPRRYVAPAIALGDLPPLDAILVTHNHFDHMDFRALSRLARSRPCPVFTPLGNDTILRRMDPRIDARAFDWGEAAQIGALRVHFEPALHWSARGRRDRRMALWASLMIEGAGQKIFCAGDTGYGDGSVFSRINQKHGPVRLAILPIGAYAPRWLMRDQHVDPEEAVKIFTSLQAEYAFACHWATFRMTDEPYHEPAVKLAAALEAADIDPARFIADPPGRVLELE